MRRIYKYSFKNSVAVDIPVGSTIMKANYSAEEGGGYVWAMVDAYEETTVPHVFKIIGTEHDVPDSIEMDSYIETVFDGPFVWHIFQIQ